MRYPAPALSVADRVAQPAGSASPQAGPAVSGYKRTALVIAAVVLLCAPVAYARMFLGYQMYDDEGLFLVAVRDYLSGQPLMTPYFPLYGPFYFEVVGGIFKLFGVLPTHDAGRLLTLAFWLASSAVGGLGAWRLTRSRWLAIAGQCITFVALAALALEPTTTYGISVLLELCLVVLATFVADRPKVTGVLIGGAVAALALIKVNVGLLAAVAVAFTWAASLEVRYRRWLFPGLAALLSVFPIVAMSSLLRQPWVIEFALVMMLSIGSLTLTSVASSRRIQPAPALSSLMLGGAAVAVPCLGVALLSGSRPDQMFQSLVVLALRFPRVYATPVGVTAAIPAWAAVLFAIAILSVRASRQTELPALARVGAGIFIWVSVLLLPSPIFLLALPVAWLSVMAPRNVAVSAIDQYARVFVPTLALLECLQAYPVAGTQVSLAGLGLMPVGAILLTDGLRQLRSGNLALARWVPRGAVAVSLAIVVAYGLVVGAAFNRATPLGLQGAQSVRVTDAQRTHLRDLVKAKAPARAYREIYLRRRIPSLRRAGLTKIQAGVTTVEEVLRVT